MKNVILITSLLLNGTTLVFVVKYWSPLHGWMKSHSETKTLKASLKQEVLPPSKVELKEVLLAQRTKIESCYDDYLRREPKKASGSIAVTWSIGSEGHVIEPSIVDAELDDLDLKKCVLEQVAQMIFDPTKFTENSQFSYRFHFKARSPGSINFE